MKKLILLALAVGAGVLAKNKSQQLKAGAEKVVQNPKVQSALSTAQDKAAPYAESVKEKVDSVTHSEPAVDDFAGDTADDLVDEGEVASATDTAPDPLTDPLPDDKS